MKFVAAPNVFKGSMSATESAQPMAEGITRFDNSYYKVPRLNSWTFEIWVMRQAGQINPFTAFLGVYISHPWFSLSEIS